MNGSGIAGSGGALPRQTASADSAWPRHIVLLVAASFGLLALFHRDVADIVAIWWGTATYAHCLLIPLIIAWLVWQRLPALRLLAPRGWWGGLVIVAGGATCWLLGELAGAAIGRHLGLVLMLQGSIVAILGPSVSRGLLFPLCYALFLVPAGDVLVPPLQTITANMCMALLALTGVPAHIEGVFIWIPNGYFEVAEACSGAKFLIAMMAYGALVANVCFTSWPRRIAFLAFAVTVPVLANGLRAFGTIYVASLTSADAAAGFDHIVYGWIFFAFVIVVVMAAAWPFFDRGLNDPWFDPARIAGPAGSVRSAWLAAGGVLALGIAVAGWSALSLASAPRMIVTLPRVPGWQASRQPPSLPWRPHYDGADAVSVGRYADGQGHIVDLGVAAFGSQAEGREVVGFGQGAIAPGGRWAWANDSAAPPGGRAFRISAPGMMREVVMFYMIAGRVTGSEAEVKLLTLRERLLGRPAGAVAILVSAEGGAARPAIDDFLRAIGPIDRVATEIARPSALP